MSIVKNVLFTSILCVAVPAVAAPLQNLNDDELEAVSGREGVIVGLEVYYNAQKSATVALDGTAIGGTAGAPDGNCTGNNNACRLALQLAGREARTLDNTKIGGTGTTAVQGEWLVIKDGYFAMKMPSLYLDASLMGSGTNAALSSGTAYESFFDIGRFQIPSGSTCLLTDGTASGTACTTANIKNTPALAMRHAHGATGYNTTTRVSSGYNDVSLSMKIGRMAVEYDTAACTYTGGSTCGYNQDAKGSFLGLHIRDNNAPFAGIAVGGKMYLYGF